ncbi:sorting nexin-22 isoform X5 [Ascaphus truei]|uniref:sorting nexin-22 isoform X5 n=1 Tax=Ascaphus truei TaxID=8439 RepID=UPI003F59527F
MIEVYVPSVGHQIQPPAKARTVFVVDVLWNGRRHTLERRYSEFHTLHKRLKKSCKVPDFPPKRLADWKCKVQERRRQGLEAYIQVPGRQRCGGKQKPVNAPSSAGVLHGSLRLPPGYRCPGERRHTRGTARILPTAQEPTQSQEDAPCKDSTFSTQSTVKNY